MLTDGVVVLRPPTPADTAALVATRDDQFRRFMGDGADDPRPTFCITIDGRVLGWVDFDRDEREWLDHDEVNLGYGLHPEARGRGAASRSVMLMLHHLAQTTDVRTATLLIHPENEWSLGVSRRCGFVDHGTIGENGSRFSKKPVPPLVYTDGIVTIRRPTVDDAEAHTAMIDDVQIDWLWEPEHRGLWEAKTPAEQLDHQRAHLQRVHDEFATGPKWTFAIEVDGEYVGHVDADLTNPHVEPGDANVSYTMAPAQRGNGHVSRAVRLVLRFIAEHTGAREAHLVVHPDNAASLRVAHAVGAQERERYVDHHGLPVVRHVVLITRSA
jgi:RimJ/RimL family protein N-acetyltransferase